MKCQNNQLMKLMSAFTSLHSVQSRFYYIFFLQYLRNDVMRKIFGILQNFASFFSFFAKIVNYKIFLGMYLLASADEPIET